VNKQNLKRKKQSLLVRLAGSSLIIGLLIRLADFLYDGLKNSMIGTLFTSYDKACEAAETSLTSGVVGRNGAKEFIRRLKYFINRQFETAMIPGLIMKGLKMLLDFPLAQYGVFFFTCGAYSAALYAASYFIEALTALPTVNLYAGIVMMAAAFPALFVKKTVKECVLSSTILDIVLFKVFGVRRSALEGGSPKKGIVGLSFLLGTLVGVATIFINPLLLPLGICGIIGGIMLLTIPETGVMIILFALPFIPTMLLAALIILVAGCYFLKLIRGKRTLKLEPVDYAVFVFMALMLFGGVVTAAPITSLKASLVYCCFIFSYILVVGLIRNGQWLMRCVWAFVGGSFFVALYGVYENFFGMAQSTWHDENLFEDISGRVVSTFENPNVLAEYLIMVLPFILTLFLIKNRTPYRLAAFICGGTAGLCLIFTWSRGAWLGIMFAVVVYFLIYSRRTMLAFAVGICAIPFLPFVLPQSIVNRFLSIGNLKDTSTNYRVNIWKAVVNMVSDHFGGGIGVGTAAFAEVYPQYSLAGIESAPHSHNLYLQVMVELGIFGLISLLAVMFLMAQCSFTFCSDMNKRIIKGEDSPALRFKLLNAAGLCSMAAILVQGMTDHVWYNYRVFCVFWLVLGLTMAAARAAKETLIDVPLPDTSVDIDYSERSVKKEK